MAITINEWIPIDSFVSRVKKIDFFTNKSFGTEQFYYSDGITFYDYIYKDHLNLSEKILNDLLPLFQKENIETVLDACCGSGHDLDFFLKNGFTVDASDISSLMIDYSKARINSDLEEKARLFQSDVLKLDKNCNKKYDLVLFRGNTLGHLNNEEQLDAIKQLYKRTKSGKFLLIDFRDGSEMFREKKSFERRGFGFDRQKWNIFFSFYNLIHPKKINNQYHITSQIFVLNLKKISFTKKKLEIDANFVVSEKIIALLKKLNCKFEFITTENTGLPYYKSILIKKE